MNPGKKKKHKKQPWQGAAKSMALGLMCLSSFVVIKTDAFAAGNNVSVLGAGGGSGYSSGATQGGAGATFNVSGASTFSSSAQSGTSGDNSSINKSANGQGASGGAGGKPGGKGQGGKWNDGAGNILSFSLGGGGGSTYGKAGGAGGLTLITGEDVGLDNFTVAGGTGGYSNGTASNGNINEKGGTGGDVNVAINSLTLENDFQISGGKGRYPGSPGNGKNSANKGTAGKNSANGGAGGNVNVTINALKVKNNFLFSGGNGGDAGSLTGDGGHGGMNNQPGNGGAGGNMGQAGAGGDVNMTVSSIEVENNFQVSGGVGGKGSIGGIGGDSEGYTTGNGGAGGKGGNGGAGGNVNMTIDSLKVKNGLQVFGGMGGNGGNGGIGGFAGASPGSNAGNAGVGGSGGYGGTGGNVNMTIGSLQAEDTVQFFGGMGGNGGNGEDGQGAGHSGKSGNSGNGQAGGQGGNVKLNISSLSLKSNLSLSSGLNGANGIKGTDGPDYTAGTAGKGGTGGKGGKGGNLDITVENLALVGGALQTINFTKNDGDLSAQVQNLDMSTGGGELLFSGTGSGAMAVSLNNILLGAGQTLLVQNTSSISASSTANLFAFNTLAVLGQNAEYSSSIPLAANGKKVTFNIEGVPASATMLNAVNAPVNIQNTKLRFMPIMSSPLIVGDNLTLVNNATGTPANERAAARLGFSRALFFSLQKQGNALNAEYTKMDANPQVKSLSEAQATGLGLANMGGDLVAGAGMSNARQASNLNSNLAPAGGLQAGSYGLVPFFALSGSSLRYNTGSHTDVNGMALVVGLAKKWQCSTTDLLLGTFFEGSWGSYTSHNSFDSVAMDSVKGKGDVQGLGGGLLARLELTESIMKGLYSEASLRLGSLSTDYHSDDLLDLSGNRASYDTNNLYYGAHFGLGYVWTITEQANLDTYAKYFWTHQNGGSVTVLEDKINFNDSDSHRTRLGTRFSYIINEAITPYIGAAWEYEFDGKATATTYGYSVPAPSLKGSTGLGELGLSWTPVPQSALSIDAGVQGYTGMREGVSGSLELKYEF